MTQTYDIRDLGPLGDGIAATNAGPAYIPFTLPGETVTASGDGKRLSVDSILKPATERVDPVCRHFGTCGACQLQHLATIPYHEWKRGLLMTALSREGIDAPIEPIQAFEGPVRRRAALTLRAMPEGLVLGYAEKGSNRLVDLQQCPVLVPEIADRFEVLKEIGAKALSGNGSIRLNVVSCQNGLDVDLELERRPKDVITAAMSELAISQKLARLTINGETIVEPAKPFITVGGHQMTPPPAGFLQAVEGAQEAMIELVRKHLKPCKRVADLFCGAGTFALPLAENSIIAAYEFDRPSLDALDSAWRASGGKLKAIETHKRDLMRSPVTFQELKKIDGVVFDPPRAGAEAQAAQLVKSKVSKIAAVSCNPQTFARDLKILVDGGFTIKSVTPIDQFQFTPHLEAVALLQRR